MIEVRHGDCLELLRVMPDNSVDAVVTDPPYGLSFMGKRWDYDVPSEEVWRECLRVLKPGGHLLAFAGTRTQHRMAVRIEDAGFEIRDMIAWVYGSGFPKSLDVGKAIDKAAGVEREVVGSGVGRTGRSAQPNGGSTFSDDAYQWPGQFDITAPATPDAERWQGWGTALKPSMEPITVARKPMVGTVAENVLAHGTGAINVDACRVPLEEDCRLLKGGTYGGNRGSDKGTSMFGTNTKGLGYEVPSANGRWPANLIHDGSDEVVGLFPVTTVCGGQKTTTHNDGMFGIGQPGVVYNKSDGDNRSAARFYYCAKASRSEREAGLDGMPETERSGESAWSGVCPECGCRMMLNGKPTCGHGAVEWKQGKPRTNHHPTVKPIALMRYLVRLVTPPGGTVLDPFTGSGTTGIAAKLEGFGFIGCEREAEYVDIARARIAAWEPEEPHTTPQLGLWE